jgi:hypothetical protein
MRVLRPFFLLGVMAFLFAGIGLFVRGFRQSSFESKLTSLSTVREVEARVGSPIYVFDSYGGWFGSNLIIKREFDRGYTIRVYRVQRIPPRFLVIKVSPDKNTVTGSGIETS